MAKTRAVWSQSVDSKFKRHPSADVVLRSGSRGVAAEEGVGLPAGACGAVGGVEEQAARELLVARGGLEIDRLVYVVGWGVISVGEPVLENFLLGRAKFEADVDFDSGNTLLDETVLIAADEGVAERLGIGDGLQAHGVCEGRGMHAEIGFLDAFNLEDFQGDD